MTAEEHAAQAKQDAAEEMYSVLKAVSKYEQYLCVVKGHHYACDCLGKWVRAVIAQAEGK